MCLCLNDCSSLAVHQSKIKWYSWHTHRLLLFVKQWMDSWACVVYVWVCWVYRLVNWLHIDCCVSCSFPWSFSQFKIIVCDYIISGLIWSTFLRIFLSPDFLFQFLSPTTYHINLWLLLFIFHHFITLIHTTMQACAWLHYTHTHTHINNQMQHILELSNSISKKAMETIESEPLKVNT